VDRLWFIPYNTRLTNRLHGPNLPNYRSRYVLRSRLPEPHHLSQLGVIEVGGTSTSTIYLLNNGNVDTVVYLESHNWVPSETSNYMVLSWDYDGTSLAPGENRAINVFLHVSSDCPELEVFKFELIIVGS